MIDTLELSWFKYIIEYDLRTQIEMAKNLRNYLNSGNKKKGGPGFYDTVRRLAERVRPLWPLLLPLVFGVGLYWLRRGRRSPSEVEGVRAHVLIRRALALLKRRGYVQAPGETLQKLAVRVSEGRDPAGPPFAALVERFYAIRFGGEPPDLPAFRGLLREVLRSPPAAGPETSSPSTVTPPGNGGRNSLPVRPD
jgi:hypothetical protein